MQDRSEIITVLDRSGSMSSTQTAAEEGFNTFVAEQRKVPNGTLTLHQFDDFFDTVYTNRPLSEVADLVLQPRGSTALYDAIGRAITETGIRLAALPEHLRPKNVIFLIITDGEENASREYSAEKIAEMIQHQTTKYNWQFIYLGSNQDAILASGKLGINPRSSLTYASSVSGTIASYRAASNAVLQARSGNEAVFSNADRTNASL